MDVAVVGAGICGLAAAYELQRRGARVTVYEAEGVASAQSAGLARIFRIAHDDPALCALALEARDGWRQWERELGAGRLLGEEGLVVAADGTPTGGAAAGDERAARRAEAMRSTGGAVAGDGHVARRADAMRSTGGAVAGDGHVARRADAMRAAGAPVAPLGGHAARGHFPFLSYDWDDAIFDPLAGALRIRRAHAALAARVAVRRERVEDLEALAADAILVCAGLGTQALVGDLDFALTDEPHVRLTYDAGVLAPCVISPELYGVPIGTTGRYAIGMHEPAAAPAMRPLPVVDRVDCVSLHAPWLDAHGDGFLALRAGRVTAFTGSNLMKFGPLIGDRLARSVLDGEIHPDLVLPQQSTFGQPDDRGHSGGRGDDR